MKVAGFGFRTEANLVSLQSALGRAGDPKGVTMIATAADKAATPVFLALGQTLGVPIAAVSKEQIKAAKVTTHSAKSQERRGTGSLSEAAALVAAGEGADLIAPRSVSADRMATCAIAERGTP